MSDWVRDDCEFCGGEGVIWNPHMLEDEYCGACLEADRNADRAALVAYIRDLEEHHVEDSDFILPDVMQEIRELRAKHPRVAAILAGAEEGAET